MPQGDQTAKKPPARRRTLPASGSAAQIREMRAEGARSRKGQSLQDNLNKLSPAGLAMEIKKRRRLIYGSIAVVSVGIMVYIVAVIFRWQQVIYVTRFSLIAFPICVALGLNELSIEMARRRPILALRILSMATLGNPQAITSLANLYIDTGDYEKAEKLLAKAVKGIDPKRRLRDYILLHAFLASTRAHIGRLAEGKKLIREVLDAAEAHHKAASTDGAAFLLAGTLNYAAEVCDMNDKIQDALSLSKRAVELVCAHKNPPLNVVLHSLINAAYFSNVVGEYQEGLAYAQRANDILVKTGIIRDSQAATIFANLGIANLGLGRGTVCKRFLSDAQTRALEPLGLKERPAVFQALAIYHFANSRVEEALVAYETAMEACKLLKPKESVFVLRIIREYTVLLKESGKVAKAKQKEQEVTMIEQMIETANKKAPPGKKDKPTLKPVAMAPVKTRFPVFWSLLILFWGFQILEQGLRLARFATWALFLTAIAVVAIKLRAKYGTPPKEETSQGAILAVVSFIPGLRTVVPELSRIPKRTSMIIVGSAAAVLAFVKITAPPKETVPGWGLLPREYLALGQDLAEKESLIKARRAFELAAKMDPAGRDGKNAKLNLTSLVPLHEQPEAAIKANLDALAKEPTDRAAAKEIWRDCTKKYPDFEWPYVHLGELYLKDDNLKKAEEQLNTALKINENCGPALLIMQQVKLLQHDSQGANACLDKYLNVTSMGGNSFLRGLADATKGLEVETKKRKAASSKTGSGMKFGARTVSGKTGSDKPPSEKTTSTTAGRDEKDKATTTGGRHFVVRGDASKHPKGSH